MSALKLITAPAAEPISLTDVEGQCRLDAGVITANGEATTVGIFITAVRQKAELYLRRPLITQTWEMVLDEFPAVIVVPLPPLQSVTSITYTDGNGDTQTLDPTTYKVDNDSEPARIVPTYGNQWPATRDEINSVRVRFVCGYGDSTGTVPVCVRQWMLLNVADLYENRELTQVGPRMTVVDAATIADGLLDAVPGGRAFRF